jgi:hypothetical protein
MLTDQREKKYTEKIKFGDKLLHKVSWLMLQNIGVVDGSVDSKTSACAWKCCLS